MELRGVVHRAISKGISKRKEDVKLRINGEERSINIQVIPINDSMSKEDFYLVLFEETPPALSLAPKPAQRQKPSELSVDEKDRRINQLEQEILTTKEYMQSIIEEQEATNEELKSANEETQSANEELQSTNEELETAKEELQSTNEELATVNEELENRNQELTRVNNDLTNLLSNVNLAIIMLDENLRIRHFTPQAQRLLNLIGTDNGRPITDIRPNFEVPDLGRLAQEIIDTMITKSADVEDSKGHFYKMIARPYRTSDNRISGAVLTFIEVTERKRRDELQRFAAVVRDSNDAITVQDFKGHILAWNPSAEKIYGYTESEALSMNIGEIIPEEHRNAARESVEQLSNIKSVMPFETERITKDGCHIRIWMTMSLLLNEDGKPRAIATTERPVDQA
jgi:two-component system CheB/CheR fusion protein